MIVTNTDEVAGRRVDRVLGLVQGSTVRAKHLGTDILSGLKNLVGGELRSYTGLMSDARQEALNRMIAEAEAMGADAVLTVRFSTASITSGAAELLAYGTAVILKDAE